MESEKTMILEAKLKGIEIIVKANDNLPNIFIDKNKMIQVLENLLQNAIKFSTKGPIIIEVKLDGDYIKTSITDRGIGIKKENFSKLFLPFETIFDERKKEKGTGLGLSIVKQIISDHRGTIEVKSEISKGTTFSFNLPIDNK